LRTELSTRIDTQGAELSRRMGGLGERIDAHGERIDALQRTMFQVGGGMIATILVALVSLLATGL
jgi:hypothetical protein